MMACCVVGLFFLRFWRDTRDRLFITFAVAFYLLAVERIVILLMKSQYEFSGYLYMIRFFAFLLILWAILDKNRLKNSS